MLPRTSRPSLANDTPDGVVAWQAGSAKSLGLVRDHDSGSTATVARQTSRVAQSEDPRDEDELAETGRRSEPPARAHGHNDDDDENLATIQRGHKRLPAFSSSHDIDIDPDADTATPVGVKKVASKPPPSPASAPAIKSATATASSLPPISGPPAPLTPITAPESGCTRVAPVVAPPPTSHGHAPHMLAHMPPPGMAMQQRSAATGPMQHLLQARAKAFALPPHRIALLVSSVLLFAAVLFLILRRSPAPVEVAAANAFPPPPVLVPAEPPPPVLPAAGGLIAPPGNPAPIVPAASTPPPAAHPHPERAASAPHHRPTPRPRVNIPVHREQ